MKDNPEKVEPQDQGRQGMWCYVLFKTRIG